MPRDLCAQLTVRLLLAARRVLLTVAVSQRVQLLRLLCASFLQGFLRVAQLYGVRASLCHLACELRVSRGLAPCRFRRVQLLRLHVGKGFLRLRQVKESLHDVIRNGADRLTHIALKRVILAGAVQLVRHVRNACDLVAHIVLARLTEKLGVTFRQHGIYLIDVCALTLPEVHLAEKPTSEVGIVRDRRRVLGRYRDLRILEVLAQLTIGVVELIIFCDGALCDALSDGVRAASRLGVGQLAGLVAAARNVVVEVCKVARDLAALDLRTVAARQLLRRLFHALAVGAHAVAAARLALPVVHALAQGLVLTLERRKLLRILRALEGVSDILIFCRGLIIRVLELVTLKRDIDRRIIILSFDDVPVVAECLARGFRGCSRSCAAVGDVSKNLGIGIAGAVNLLYRRSERTVVPCFRRIAHAARRVVVDDHVIAGRVNRFEQLFELSLCHRHFAIRQRLRDVQIAFQQLPAVALVALSHAAVIGEVETLTLHAPVHAHKVCRKFCELRLAAVVYRNQPPVFVANFTALEVFLLLFGQLAACAVFFQ